MECGGRSWSQNFINQAGRLQVRGLGFRRFGLRTRSRVCVCVCFFQFLHVHVCWFAWALRKTFRRVRHECLAEPSRNPEMSFKRCPKPYKTLTKPQQVMSPDIFCKGGFPMFRDPPNRKPYRGYNSPLPPSHKSWSSPKSCF